MTLFHYYKKNNHKIKKKGRSSTMVNLLLAIATSYLVGFIINGFVIAVLIAYLIVIFFKSRKERRALKSAQRANEVATAAKLNRRRRIIYESGEYDTLAEFAKEAELARETVIRRSSRKLLQCGEGESKEGAKRKETTAPTVESVIDRLNEEDIRIAESETAMTTVESVADSFDEPEILPESVEAVKSEGETAELTGTDIRIQYSFMARLLQSDDTVKKNFISTVNSFLSYGKVKQRVSWNCITFNYGRMKLARLRVIGKSLYLYLSLDPAEFIGSKYRVKDVSDKKKYESVPMLVKIKSKRGAKYAQELIATLASRLSLVATNAPLDDAKTDDLQYLPLEDLIEKKLVKVRVVRRGVKTNLN